MYNNATSNSIGRTYSYRPLLKQFRYGDMWCTDEIEQWFLELARHMHTPQVINHCLSYVFH